MPSFVGTNILIYAEDHDAKSKHAIARELIVDLWERGDGVVSVQVLHEFFVNVTRKRKRPLSVAKAREIVGEYSRWNVVENTTKLLADALVLHEKSQLSFWDSMIVQPDARGVATRVTPLSGSAPLIHRASCSCRLWRCL